MELTIIEFFKWFMNDISTGQQFMVLPFIILYILGLVSLIKDIHNNVFGDIDGPLSLAKVLIIAPMTVILIIFTILELIKSLWNILA